MPTDMRGTAIRIIGIDPGLRRTGWGVVESDGVRLSYVASGLITSTADADLAYRLRELFEGIASVIAVTVLGVPLLHGGWHRNKTARPAYKTVKTTVK